MGEDTKNEDGLLKDTYSDKKKKKKDVWSAVARIINHLADQGQFGTEARQKAITEASKDEPETKTEFKGWGGKKVYK